MTLRSARKLNNGDQVYHKIKKCFGFVVGSIWFSDNNKLCHMEIRLVSGEYLEDVIHLDVM